MYPIGIPVLYAVILWQNRELLNPRIQVEPDGANAAPTKADPAGGDEILSWTLATSSKRQDKSSPCYLELQELAKRVKARKDNPELVPSMFLWKDFGESFKLT